MVPLGFKFMRWRTFSDAFVMADEMQNITPAQVVRDQTVWKGASTSSQLPVVRELVIGC